jgi:ketol-acid reductoisomerase
LVRESLREKYFTNQEKEAKEALKRIASGDFALSEAIEWEEIEKSLEKVYKDETD